MTIVDDQGRTEPPLAADETATLLGFLDYQRATLAWKCAGLDAAGLVATTAASSMTLGGLLKHMAYVESEWFSRSLHGPGPGGRRWTRWTGRPIRTGSGIPPPRTPRTSSAALWQDAVERSRGQRRGGPGRRRPGPTGPAPLARRPAPSLRWILCHMIEEYARHNGHADLLREALDGETGE